MKKSFIAAVLIAAVAVFAVAEIERKSNISPASTSQFNAPNVATIAAVTGQRNCVKNIDMVALGDYQLRVLTGDTTSYAITLSSGQSLVRSWDENDALCGEKAEIVYIRITTVTAGTFELNYSGYRY